MAGAAFTWKQGLSSAVASNLMALMAPLDAMFTVEYTGVGEDGIKVPTSSGGLTMSAGTKGTPGASDSDYAFGGITITPTPRFVSVPVAEDDLETASPAQIDDLVAALTEAAHQELINDLEAAIAARLTNAANQYEPATVATFGEADLRGAKWKLRGNKAPGKVYGILTSEAMSELEGDLVTKNLFGRTTTELIDGQEYLDYAGVTLYPDVYLGDDAGTPKREYNLLATKRGVRIAYGGVGPKIKVLPTEDPINVRLTMSMYLKVDIPNANLAMWVRSQTT